MIVAIIKGEGLTFLVDLFINRQRDAIIIVWEIVAIISIAGVTESALKISFGAGINDQKIVGIIININNNKLQKSNPNLYLFIIHIPPWLNGLITNPFP
jgi:hypothetical protein